MSKLINLDLIIRLLLSVDLFVFLLILIQVTTRAGTFISGLAFLFSFIIFLLPVKNTSRFKFLHSRLTSWLAGGTLVLLIIIYLFLISTGKNELRICNIETYNGSPQCNMRCTVVVEGEGLARLKPGDRLAVYGAQARLVSGEWWEVPIAVLGVVHVEEKIAIAQLLLVHEAAGHDPGKRLETGLKAALTRDLNKSFLLPSFGHGYVIDNNRVRLKPGGPVQVNDRLMVLEPQVQGDRIVDLLPGETRLQVVQLGEEGQIARVKVISGPPPPPGTLVQFEEAPLPSIEPDMLLVKGASMRMGSLQGEEDEKPVHLVILKDFYISGTEITNARYGLFIQDNGYHNPGYWTEAGNQWREKNKVSEPRHWRDPLFYHPHQPVVGVTWYEASAYANWLSSKTGKIYRLPSEAQWELACSSTAGRLYPWGNQWNGRLANYADYSYATIYDHDWADRQINDGYIYSAPVGSFSGGATSEGILDMAGNVWEWTSSLYRLYPYNPGDGRENILDPGERVTRGGGWGSYARQCRCANRTKQKPGYSSYNLGFRLVRPLQ
ncbi:MAG: formylglycine-generating enzyme family protein [Candidatus Aminicenantes bacterium]|jgi:formylglycine-generating enzyme required for sulfatase activity